MPQDLPDGGPVWVSFLVYGAAALGALAAIVQGWKTARKPSDAQNTLIAGDIMDTRPMRDLATQVERLGEHVAQLAQAEDRRAAADDRKSAALDRNTDAVRDLCLTIERSKP